MSQEMFEQLFTLSLKVSPNGFAKGIPAPVSLSYYHAVVPTQRRTPLQVEPGGGVVLRRRFVPPPKNFQSFT